MADDLAHYSATQPHDAPALDAVLGWLQRQRTRKAPLYPPRQLQLDELRRHGRALFDLEGDADAFLRACGRPGPVPGSVGRLGGSLLVAYFRWGEGFADLEVEPHLQYFHDELDTAASYRTSMLRAALQLAFSNDPAMRADHGRDSLTGLGDAHTRLVEVLDHLTSIHP